MNANSTAKIIAAWEADIVAWLVESIPPGDPAHDVDHLLRVWHCARNLALEEEGADLLIVLAASLLHDVVSVPKNHPDRPMASRMAAARAANILSDMGFPANRIEAVGHAIEAHSFSAGIAPRTIEARIVQDADRLDALGAIGIARCFIVGGLMQRGIAHRDDPMGEHRALDDQAFTLDHFGVKLLGLPNTMQTETGRRIARERTAYLVEFRDRLIAEMNGQA